MATQISNQATLNYKSGTTPFSTSSNTAVVTMRGPVEVNKYSLEGAYQIGGTITYNVFITNTSTNTLTQIIVEDDLGTYVPTGMTTYVTPLTYIDPAKLYVDQAFTDTVTGAVSEDADSVTFTIDSLKPGHSLLLQYKCLVNEYAGADTDPSTISNNASVTAAGVLSPTIANNTIPVASYANLLIEKSMSPDPVVDGNTLTYTFNISNFGTIPATDVVLQDLLETSPILTSVTVGGTMTDEYSYADDGTFTYPAASSTNTYTIPAATSTSTYTIPAATFTRSLTTGVVTVTPGTSQVIIQGTV